MKIKVLGTRGEIEASAPLHTKHSGVLIDNTILLDVGEEEFQDYKPEAIFITHLHPDHAFFVTGRNLKAEVPVYAPEPWRSANVTVINGKVNMGPYTVTPVPTHHSKLVKSIAYLVMDGGQKLLYTGDIIWVNKEYHHFFANLNLVITDGSYFRRGGLVRKDKETGQLYGHNGIPDLIKLFQPFSRHIMFVHFGSWFYKDSEEAGKKLEKLGQENGVEVHVGYDGLEVDLDKLLYN